MLFLVFKMGSFVGDLVFWVSVITMAVVSVTVALPYFFIIEQAPLLRRPTLAGPVAAGLSGAIFFLPGTILSPSAASLCAMVGAAYGFVTGLIASVIAGIWFACRGSAFNQVIVQKGKTKRRVQPPPKYY